jgi:hypothetical protein
MSRSIFGWDLPPGVTTRMLPGYDDPPCEICGRGDDCICPECPVCQGYGDPHCYRDHGLQLTKEQVVAISQVEIEQAKENVLAREEAHGYLVDRLDELNLKDETESFIRKRKEYLRDATNK